MDASMVIQTLQNAGAGLELHGDKLRVNALPGTLTDDMRGLIREHKKALIAILLARDQVETKPLPHKPATPAPSQTKLPLPVLHCSNCGSTKLEPRFLTTLCLQCGEIDEWCPGCDELIRDSDEVCRKCGRVLV